MKSWVYAFLAIVFFAPWVSAGGTSADLQRIDKLIADHRYAEALAAHKKFFEDSKSSSGMGGVRLSFALASWAELGRRYPPAKVALNDLSASHKRVIYAGSGTFDIYQEYSAINEYLEKNNETLETFKFVDKQYPAEAQGFYAVVRQILIDNKQYDLIRKYEQDPVYAYEELRNTREYELSQLRQNKPGYNLNRINTDFDRGVKKLIDITEKIDRQDESAEITRRYSTYMNGNLLRKYH